MSVCHAPGTGRVPIHDAIEMAGGSTDEGTEAQRGSASATLRPPHPVCPSYHNDRMNTGFKRNQTRQTRPVAELHF